MVGAVVVGVVGAGLVEVTGAVVGRWTGGAAGLAVGVGVVGAGATGVGWTGTGAAAAWVPLVAKIATPRSATVAGRTMDMHTPDARARRWACRGDAIMAG